MATTRVPIRCRMTPEIRSAPPCLPREWAEPESSRCRELAFKLSRSCQATPMGGTSQSITSGLPQYPSPSQCCFSRWGSRSLDGLSSASPRTMATPDSLMSTQAKPFQPFVPEHMQMRELTLRAVLLGLAMTIVLGAANAYLGLRAGITVAATYPAAVIGMAILRTWKGSLLEENIARTSGSIGEGVAAGAIFTIPAFLISHAWSSFGFREAYWKTSALILVGSVLGVLFISLVRRVMVEDAELPFPESLAASEIHKAGQRGAQAAKYLFWSMGLGGLIFLLGRFGFFAADSELAIPVGRLGATRVRLGGADSNNILNTGGVSTFAAPSVSPAYLGVGYVIGARLAALQFSGGVLAWGLMVPLLIYFLGPQLKNFLPAGAPAGLWAPPAGRAGGGFVGAACV